MLSPFRVLSSSGWKQVGETHIPLRDRWTSEDRIISDINFLFLGSLFKYHCFEAFPEIKSQKGLNTRNFTPLFLLFAKRSNWRIILQFRPPFSTHLFPFLSFCSSKCSLMGSLLVSVGCLPWCTLGPKERERAGLRSFWWHLMQKRADQVGLQASYSLGDSHY